MSLDLRNAPLSALMAELIFRICEHDRDAAVATGGMIKLIQKMSAGLPETKRFELSERLRDLADELERRRVVVRI
jgi:hypothetical protein